MAKAEHDKPIPTEVLKSFPLPDVKSISWIPVQSVQQAGAGRKSGPPSVANDINRHVSGDGPPLPFFVQYDHVKVRTLYIFCRTKLKVRASSPISLASMLFYP